MVRIAVVGAGVGGTTVARYLTLTQSTALQVTLFERRPSPDGPDGGALTIQGEGLKVLEELGLSKALLGSSESAAEKVSVMRDALLNLLLDGLSDRMTLRFNTEIAAVRELSGQVELDLRPLLVLDGATWVRNKDASVVTEVFDIIIGADGNAPASCVARHIAGVEGAQARPIPMLILQALVPCPGSTRLAPDKELYLRKGARGVVGKLMLGTALGRVGSCEVPASGAGGLQPWEVCTILTISRNPMETFPHPSQWAEVMKQNASLCSDDAARAAAVALVEQAADTSSGGRLHAWVPFRKDGLERWWSEGHRLVALGDAAHLMPPTMGWGANCAMGDAKRLAEVFTYLSESGLLVDPITVADCLQDPGHAFEAERRAAVAPCVKASLDEAKKIVDRRL